MRSTIRLWTLGGMLGLTTILSVARPWASEAASCGASTDDVRSFVKREIAVPITDAVLDASLQHTYPGSSVHFADVFRILFLVDDVHECVAVGRYADVAALVAKVPQDQIQAAALASLGLTSVKLIANIWTLPVKLFLQHVTDIAFTNNITRYRKAQNACKAPKIAPADCHNMIISRSAELRAYGVDFDSGGWIFLTDEPVLKDAQAERVPGVDAAAVYNYARLVLDASAGSGAAKQDQSTALNQLRPIVQSIQNRRPTLAVSPVVGSRDVIFLESGLDFTPGATATIHRRKPDGTEEQVSQPIDAQGRFVARWVPGPQGLVGTYQVWGVDSQPGKVSNTITYAVTGPVASVNPQLSVYPLSGSAMTMFNQSGQGFTPNSSATVYYQKPDGSTYPPVKQPTDAQGRYQRQWTPGPQALVGTYRAWAVDDSTRRQSVAIGYAVTVAPRSASPTPLPVPGSTLVVSPQLSVSPVSGGRGTTFSQPGQGFTPNATATVYYRKPDGTTYPPVRQPTDGQGRYMRQWMPGPQALVGTYQAWAVDDRTGRQSRVISYTVTAR